MKTDTSSKESEISTFSLFNVYMQANMDTTLKTSMQLTCDKDSKVFDNMADEVGLSFNALIFSDKLKEKHVKSDKNFPEIKIGINLDSSQ